MSPKLKTLQDFFLLLWPFMGISRCHHPLMGLKGRLLGNFLDQTFLEPPPPPPPPLMVGPTKINLCMSSQSIHDSMTGCLQLMRSLLFLNIIAPL